MTKIIGHRGAAGLALENTRAAMLAALDWGVDVIEFDVRRTADDHLVVMHDPVTDRVSDEQVTIYAKTLAELQTIKLHNGETIASLDEILDLIDDRVPVIIELKDAGSLDELLLVLARHPALDASIASFNHEELWRVRQALPDIPIFALEHLSSLEIINTARSLQATGIGLNKWIVNPLTYLLARRYGMELYLYKVNTALIGRFLRTLYPRIDFCTNRPDRFLRKRRRASRRWAKRHAASRR